MHYWPPQSVLWGGHGPPGPPRGGPHAVDSCKLANIIEFIIYSYIIEDSDYKFDIGFCNTGYVSEIFKFLE